MGSYDGKVDDSARRLEVRIKIQEGDKKRSKNSEDPPSPEGVVREIDYPPVYFSGNFERSQVRKNENEER